MYRVEELQWVIATYRVYEFNNHYVEAQVWADESLQPYVDSRYWQRCK